MILAIDIGNTNISLGGFDRDEIQFISRISTNHERTDDEYAVSILQMLSLHGIEKESIRGVIIASVVPPLNAVIKNAVSFLFGTEPLFVGPGIKTGIGIHCDIPSSVGADIITESVAAFTLYGGPALIIDVGTATMMTVINNKGAFIGTSIAPGVMMGLDSLSTVTAQLPMISLGIPDKIIAKNTADCMRSGVLYGNASMIDGMIVRIKKEFGEELKVYATGGLSSLIIPLCEQKIELDEHLVLKGLNILYKKNRS